MNECRLLLWLLPVVRDQRAGCTWSGERVSSVVVVVTCSLWSKSRLYVVRTTASSSYIWCPSHLVQYLTHCTCWMIVPVHCCIIIIYYISNSQAHRLRRRPLSTSLPALFLVGHAAVSVSLYSSCSDIVLHRYCRSFNFCVFSFFLAAVYTFIIVVLG